MYLNFWNFLFFLLVASLYYSSIIENWIQASAFETVMSIPAIYMYYYKNNRYYFMDDAK